MKVSLFLIHESVSATNNNLASPTGIMCKFRCFGVCVLY